MLSAESKLFPHLLRDSLIEKYDSICPVALLKSFLEYIYIQSQDVILLLDAKFAISVRTLVEKNYFFIKRQIKLYTDHRVKYNNVGTFNDCVKYNSHIKSRYFDRYAE